MDSYYPPMDDAQQQQQQAWLNQQSMLEPYDYGPMDHGPPPSTSTPPYYWSTWGESMGPLYPDDPAHDRAVMEDLEQLPFYGQESEAQGAPIPAPTGRYYSNHNYGTASSQGRSSRGSLEHYAPYQYPHYSPEVLAGAPSTLSLAGSTRGYSDDDDPSTSMCDDCRAASSGWGPLGWSESQSLPPYSMPVYGTVERAGALSGSFPLPMYAQMQQELRQRWPPRRPQNEFDIDEEQTKSAPF